MKNFSIIFFIGTLSACSVGPDYTSPKELSIQSYTGEDKREFITTISAQWWKAFQSPALNQLIILSIKNNYSLQAMRETLQQAQENVLSAQGQRLPNINFNAGPAYEKYGVSAFGDAGFTVPAFYYYSFGPTINWTLDLFGKVKRTIEQQQALVHYQTEELRGAKLTLTGNIITTSFTIASLSAQINTIKNIIHIDKNYIQQIGQGILIGSTTQENIVQAKTQLHNDEALLPDLEQQLTNAQNELNILVGKFPADWQAPKFNLENFTLPKKLPLIVPSQLVHQRPDIAAAEALLHASSAAVGVATANLYPQISLSANISQEALSPGQLFDSSSTAASVFAGITAPIFSGGMLEAQKRAAEHAYKASYANYQDVVVRAFVQVSNVLHALNHDDEQILATENIIASRQQTLTLTQKGVYIGSKNELTLLQAKRNVQLAHLKYIQAIAQRYRDTAQLYLTLGGSLMDSNK